MIPAMSATAPAMTPATIIAANNALQAVLPGNSLNTCLPGKPAGGRLDSAMRSALVGIEPIAQRAMSATSTAGPTRGRIWSKPTTTTVARAPSAGKRYLECGMPPPDTCCATVKAVTAIATPSNPAMRRSSTPGSPSGRVFITELRAAVEAGATVGDVAGWLTLDYVIAQHERVASAKLPTTGDTFRFRREAGRLRFFPKDAQVGMNDSRFNALATFIFELGWSGYLYVPDHGLTPEGELMRSQGDLPSTGALAPPSLEYA